MSDPAPLNGPADPIAPPLTSPQPWWMLPTFGAVSYLIFGAGLVLAYQLENPTLFNVALGAAIMQASTVNNFFFGSSKSSQDKDASAAQSAITKDATIAETAKALSVSSPVKTTKIEAPDGTTTTVTGPTEPVATPQPAPPAT